MTRTYTITTRPVDAHVRLIDSGRPDETLAEGDTHDGKIQLTATLPERDRAQVVATAPGYRQRPYVVSSETIIALELVPTP